MHRSFQVCSHLTTMRKYYHLLSRHAALHYEESLFLPRVDSYSTVLPKEIAVDCTGIAQKLPADRSAGSYSRKIFALQNARKTAKLRFRGAVDGSAHAPRLLEHYSDFVLSRNYGM